MLPEAYSPQKAAEVGVPGLRFRGAPLRKGTAPKGICRFPLRGSKRGSPQTGMLCSCTLLQALGAAGRAGTGLILQARFHPPSLGTSPGPTSRARGRAQVEESRTCRPLLKKHLFFLRQLPPDVGRIVEWSSLQSCSGGRGCSPGDWKRTGRFLSKRNRPFVVPLRWVEVFPPCK